MNDQRTVAIPSNARDLQFNIADNVNFLSPLVGITKLCTPEVRPTFLDTSPHCQLFLSIAP